MPEAERPTARARWHRPALLYGLYTVVLFGFFLWATFPADVLLHRLGADLEARSGLHLEFGKTTFGWYGHTVRDLRVVRPSERETPLVEASWAAARPSAVGFLIRGTPLRLRGDLYGGWCSGWMAWSMRRLDVTCRELDTSRYRGPFGLDGWAGHVSGEVRLARDQASEWLRGSGRIRLEMRDVRLGDLSPLLLAAPDLRTAEPFLAGQEIEVARVAARLERGTLRMEEGAVRTQDVELDMRGTILLRQPLGLSLPNLTLELRGVSAAANILLTALPGQTTAGDGRYRFRLGGTLARPRLVPQAPQR